MQPFLEAMLTLVVAEAATPRAFFPRSSQLMVAFSLGVPEDETWAGVIKDNTRFRIPCTRSTMHGTDLAFRAASGSFAEFSQHRRPPTRCPVPYAPAAPRPGLTLSVCCYQGQRARGCAAEHHPRGA
eukprot:3396915-Rhodomonas_salina.2